MHTSGHCDGNNKKHGTVEVFLLVMILPILTLYSSRESTGLIENKLLRFALIVSCGISFLLISSLTLLVSCFLIDGLSLLLWPDGFMRSIGLYLKSFIAGVLVILACAIFDYTLIMVMSKNHSYRYTEGTFEIEKSFFYWLLMIYLLLTTLVIVFFNIYNR